MPAVKAAKPALEFVPIDPPPRLELTPDELEVFKSEDDNNHYGTDRHRVIRMGDTLIGWHYNPYGTPPPEYPMLKHVAETWVIVHGAGQTRRVPLVPKHEFRKLVPSPSGRRFLVVSDKGPVGDDKVAPGGHAIEVELDRLETSVAVTGTTGRTGGFMGSASSDVQTVWAIDYAGDDDTLVASITQHKMLSLVLFERDPDTRRFVEVDRVKAPAHGTRLTTAGRVISVSAGKKLTVFGVTNHQLVKLGTVAKPAESGPVLAHPEDTREQLVFFDREGASYYQLVNHDVLLAAAKPKKKKKSA